LEKDLILEMIEKLRSGQINEWYVNKEVFLDVRAVIVALEDFKHFRGIAQRSGGVIYQYLQEPRS
jgi:hypothetical protein